MTIDELRSPLKDSDVIKRAKEIIVRIELEVSIVNQNIRDNEQRYMENKKIYERQLAEIRNRCPHFQTKHNPDPSGNNDYTYRCNTCGKEAKNL